MEMVPLSTRVLETLAHEDPLIRPYFQGVYPADRLPRQVLEGGYIVNTDPHDQPGQHWLALWVEKPSHCEMFDSYGLPLKFYKDPSLHRWWNQFATMTRSGQSIQSLQSQACGHYCIQYLKAKAKGNSLIDFLAQWDEKDLVENDVKVGHMIQSSVLDQVMQGQTCQSCECTLSQLCQ